MLSLFRPTGTAAYRLWPWLLYLTILLGTLQLAYGMTDDTLRDLKQETRDIFYHGFENYMHYAFPEDELRPLTCAALTRDRANPAHIEVNDVLGNYSLTLIDSLSTLAILASSEPLLFGRSPALEQFQDGIATLVELYGDGVRFEKDGTARVAKGARAQGFDLDSKVQVFETTIRGVGGLLSAHLFSVGDLPIRGYEPKQTTQNGKSGIRWDNGFVYDGQMLRLAHDLARRLLPAFHTPTGLPYPRVNLRTGVPFYANSPLNVDAENGQCLTGTSSSGSAEITETCSAGAGSLVLEFSTLSRLTGDDRFEIAAKRAFLSVWRHRSTVGLIGSGIDAESGQWISPYTGIGAGIDSFFEYAFKSHVLLSGLEHEPGEDNATPDDFLRVWQDSHVGIQRHIYRSEAYQHPHYIQADLYTGATRAFWVDSLSAYYPGLLALAGELEEATATHLLYTALWTRYSAIPERWSTASGNIEGGLRWWGGRPEFIESTWYIYRATKDPWYLHVGEMALRDIKRRCWTKCGWAGLQDVTTGELNDRMESFFLGETVKYLYLLFDEDHPLNTWDAPWVMTTEGHPLIIPPRLRPHQRKRSSNRPRPTQWEPIDQQPVCPLPPAALPLSVSSTAARSDIFHAASLARLHLMPTEESVSSPLQEFTHDHPSISLTDLHSPSNYTYYPWTLPLNLVPWNGTSSKMAARMTFDLSFPNMPDNMAGLSALQRIAEGIMVNSLSNVRLGMIKEASGSGRVEPLPTPNLDDLFRIYAVSNVALGRDEKVYIKREAVVDLNGADPYFTRMRDLNNVDLIIDAAPLHTPVSPSAFNAETSSDEADNTTQYLLTLPNAADFQESNMDDSTFSSLLRNILSSLIDIPTGTPSDPAPTATLIRETWGATLPTGPGAAPFPDLTDPSPLQPGDAESTLPWTSIYVHDDPLCDQQLPKDIPRQYQILVIPRGLCSFSQKLRNIPLYPPSPTSLQLVVIVSYPEHQNDADGGMLVQPLLHEAQTSPSGLERRHPIPVVMVGGGGETMGVLRRARGVGVRRRWWVSSQGVRIGNLFVV